MKKYLFIPPALVLAGALHAKNNIDNDMQPYHEDNTRWQVWAGLGAGFLGDSEADLDQRMQDLNLTNPDASNVQNVSLGYHFGVDYFPFSWIGVQYSYLNMGNITADLKGIPTTDLVDSYNAISSIHPTSAQGHKLAIQGRWMATDSTNLYLNAGAFIWESYYSSVVPKGTLKEDLTLTSKHSGVAPMLGLRLDQTVFNDFFAYGEIQGAYLEENVRMLGTIGIGYRIPVARTVVIPPCVYDKPSIALNDESLVSYLATKAIHVAANDQEISSDHTLVISKSPQYGHATLEGKNIIYTHTSSHSKPDELQYHWRNNSTNSNTNTAIVHLNIEPVETLSMRLEVYFDNNSSIIDKKYYAEIKRISDFMIENNITDVTINGYTSSAGSDEYNQFLSERRAKNVMNLMVSKFNIPKEHLRYQALGETSLFFLNDDNEEKQAANRRVQTTIEAVIHKPK